MSEQNPEGGAVPLERIVGRFAAGWKLRAITLEQSGVMLASQCLRECADELEAALQGRDPQRTSWYAHEDEPLAAGPHPPVEVYCYWPDGQRKHLEFDCWPQREQLPADAIRFDIAWPDPMVTGLEPPNEEFSRGAAAPSAGTPGCAAPNGDNE